MRFKMSKVAVAALTLVLVFAGAGGVYAAGNYIYQRMSQISDEEKEEMADEFAEKYEGKVEDFISLISEADVAVTGTYKDTWKFIEKEKHSLERHSNMHLIFK